MSLALARTTYLVNSLGGVGEGSKNTFLKNCFHPHEPKLVLSEERRKDTENIDNVNPKRYKKG